jgi:hypothetical protein
LGKGCGKQNGWRVISILQKRNSVDDPAQSGLEIELLQTMTVNDEKWRRVVTIETPGVDFPAEHIMMILKKPKEVITP